MKIVDLLLVLLVPVVWGILLLGGVLLLAAPRKRLA